MRDYSENIGYAGAVQPECEKRSGRIAERPWYAKMVSSVGELEVGNIFEGTVNSVRGGKVLLALGNGQMVLAQMDGRVNITPGSSMFFR